PTAAAPVEGAGAAAPATWREWVIEGTLIDDLEVVRGFLAPIMAQSRDWGASKQLEVRARLVALGYEASLASLPLPGGGVRAVIHLAPVPVVRGVRVEVDMGLVTRVVDPVFRDELVRRMTLRPGSPLPSDRPALRRCLDDQQERLRAHLQNDGFFDA